jgi:EmrB/QacA subfamily drug resistance transporter
MTRTIEIAQAPVAPAPSAAPSPPADGSGGESRASTARWRALAVLLTAGFMDLLDTTIVNVAIPSIRSGIGAEYAAIQWVVAGYLLAVAVGLVTFGRLGDVLGRRKVFLAGVVGFGLTSLACGLAPEPQVLALARGGQGLCAAAMIPQILATIQSTFPREEQRRAIALYSAMAGVAVMSGPLLGGLLIDVLDLSWRSIFLVNVPVSVLLVVATLRFVPESRSDGAPRLDLGGSALLGLTLFVLVFALIQGREFDWAWWVRGMLLAAPLLLAVFALHQRRQSALGISPLVPLRLFDQPPFSVGLVIVLVFFSGVVGLFLTLSVFLQLGLGLGPMESALTVFPSSVGMVVSSLASQKLTSGLGRRGLALGALMMAVAMAVLLYVVVQNAGRVTAGEIRPIMFGFGLGMGLALPSLTDAVVGAVHSRDAGAASGVLNTGLQVGNAIGVAIVGTILFATLSSHAPETAEQASVRLAERLSNVGQPAAARDATVDAFRTCFIDASREKDPEAVPASCRDSRTGEDAISVATAAAHEDARDWARRDNFSAALEPALKYEVGVFALSSLLLLLFPRMRYVGRHRSVSGRSTRRRHARPTGIKALLASSDQHTPVHESMR